MISSIVFANAVHVLGAYTAYLIAICNVESGMQNVHSWRDGGSPSFGVCQIKAKTAAWIAGHKNVTFNSLNVPSVNAYYAAKYLEFQMRRYPVPYRMDCAISAYNAGSCSMKNFKTYVRKVRMGL